MTASDDSAASEGVRFPTEDWIRAWRRELNDNDAYAAAADGWGVGFDGDFVFEVRPDRRYDGDPVVYHVELEDGECLGARAVDGVAASDYGFALRADYTDWVRVIHGELDAMAVATGGAFDVEGSKLKVMQYADAAAAMLDTATLVDTEFSH